MSENKEDELALAPYDDPELVEVKQKVNYQKLGYLLADAGDNFFPSQYFANPFNQPLNNAKKSMFFPLNWQASTNYEKKLVAVAEDFIKNTNKEVSAHSMKEVMSGLNPLHPFLEVGGALRTQVPLPMSMEELYSLVDIILNNNKNNTDAWKMPKDGFKTTDIKTAIRVDEGKAILPWSGENKKIDRSILVWDDVAGSAGINTEDTAPNFFKLLGSIIFQRCDEIAYNARGRYGAHVLRRLIDGHAYPNKDKSRTVVAFAYDRKTGFPYGYYAGLLSNTDTELSSCVPGSKENNIELSATVPSVLLNYTFCKDAPDGEYGRRTTWLMTSHLLAYTSKYITGLPIEAHELAIHTDKSAASKSTQKMMSPRTEPVTFVTSDAVAVDIFKSINRGQGKESFTYPFPASLSPGVIRVDQSTVPLMDAGEEVPEPVDRFYIGIFGKYSELVGRYCNKNIGKFQNGKLETNFSIKSLYLPSEEARKTISHLQKTHDFNTVCESNNLDPKEIIEWLQKQRSLKIELLGTVRIDAVLQKDMRISDKFPLNFGCKWQSLDNEATPLKLRGNEKILSAIFESLRFWAKLGNTANQYHKYASNPMKENVKMFTPKPESLPMEYVPRLTDMGFIIVGGVSSYSPMGFLAAEKANNYLPHTLPQKQTKKISSLFKANRKIPDNVDDYAGDFDSIAYFIANNLGVGSTRKSDASVMVDNLISSIEATGWVEKRNS